MNIASTQYTLSNKNFEIYLAGCRAKPHCKDCHNPELWDFKYGERLTKARLQEIKNKIELFDNLIDSISLMGGEPLDQHRDELLELCKFLEKFNKDIWLFTRYELEEIPKNIVKYFSYVKCGRYLPDKKDDHEEYGVVLATSNQHIYKRGKDY